MINRRKVGMTSSQHGLYVWGYTCYNGQYNRRDLAEGANQGKTGLSSDCRLQLACMKLESLVIADQHAAVNTFQALYCSPVTSRKLAVLEVAAPTRKRQAPKSMVSDWGEVVTR